MPFGMVCRVGREMRLLDGVSVNPVYFWIGTTSADFKIGGKYPSLLEALKTATSSWQNNW